MKIKVAIIDHLGAHGSSHHFYLFGQAQGLIANGIKVGLYTNIYTSNPGIKDLEFHQFYKGIFSKKSRILTAMRYFVGSIRSHFHARISSCNVFHYHIFGFSILVLFNMVLAKLLFAKIVLTIHDVRSFSDSNVSSFYTRLIYFFSDSILTHNRFSKHEILKFHEPLQSKISIIPHGNYLPFIKTQHDQESSRRRLDISLDSKVLLFFGMIKKVKGLDLLLRAMPKIIEENSEVILLIAGKPWKDDFSKYHNLINDLHINSNCLLHIKFISYDDVEYYYSASDIVVLPYNKIYQSGVLMMSLSYGKPVVLSDLDSFKEIIEDKKSALLFKSGDVKSLANIINNTFDSPKLLKNIGLNGLKLMKEKYNWKEIGKQTRDAYYKINYFYKK
jgi:D-inositol-3-phosphate glycosyltransferase